ncbi:unnamed protein product [Zymoseptoria tritici ST99CH_3D7]|uniref:Uncharacterized protein n=1 Tax=Zymoseptoria tritici (strain ST99CH_3D7) TaxID=1276538 RepID=A0A1X7RE56_ZYMT9|nr:unnamed protein product [Zymoseptoria tritici ST99CH_3D7]
MKRATSIPNGSLPISDLREPATLVRTAAYPVVQCCPDGTLFASRGLYKFSFVLQLLALASLSLSLLQSSLLVLCIYLVDFLNLGPLDNLQIALVPLKEGAVCCIKTNALWRTQPTDGGTSTEMLQVRWRMIGFTICFRPNG